jgi:glutamine synthetase
MGVYAKKGEKREEIKARLKEAGVQYLWAQFVDMNGAAKVKQVPFDAFDDIVDEGAGFAGGAKDRTAMISWPVPT